MKRNIIRAKINMPKKIKPNRIKLISLRRSRVMEVSVAKVTTITGIQAKTMIQTKRIDTTDYKKEYEEMLKKYGIEEV